MRNAPLAIIPTLALLLSACGSPPKTTDRAPDRDAPEGVSQRASAPTRDPAPSVEGIGLTLLTVDDKGSRVAATLAPYDRDIPEGVFDETEHAGWRSWGLRWVAVPLGELERVLGAQRPTRPIETRDMGTFPRWQPLIRVGQIDNVAVRSPGGVSRVLSGRPRLLARSWRVPVINDGVRERVVKLDLALQLESTPEQSRDPFAPKLPTSEYALGRPLGPGLMSVTMRADHALVLVGVSPDTQWAVADDGSGVAFKPDRVLGPGATLERSLGEVMLSRSGSNPRKVLVVLIPEAGDP